MTLCNVSLLSSSDAARCAVAGVHYGCFDLAPPQVWVGHGCKGRFVLNGAPVDCNFPTGMERRRRIHNCTSAVLAEPLRRPVDHCAKLRARCRRRQEHHHAAASSEPLPLPEFVAVVSHWDEEVGWTKRLPIPALVYEHGRPWEPYSVAVNKGSEASATLQYIVDHYDCLPRWTLVLHAHGQTAPKLPGPGFRRHHPLDPTTNASLVDVDRAARGGGGFLPTAHLRWADWEKDMHPAAKAVFDGGAAPTQSHPIPFMPQQMGKIQCACGTVRAVLPDIDCRRAWGWPLAGEFWASRDAIRRRPLQFWRNALDVAITGSDAGRFGNLRGSVVTPTAYCFESIWHHLLGEPLRGYVPPYKTFEEMPRVSVAERRSSCPALS